MDLVIDLIRIVARWLMISESDEVNFLHISRIMWLEIKYLKEILYGLSDVALSLIITTAYTNHHANFSMR